MSKYLSDQNLHILTNVISGVETYGQRYSDERDWGDFTEAYANTKNEHSITIGWAANYGDEARKLLQLIQKDYPNDFKNNDKANIASDIKSSFVVKPYYQPKKTSAKAKSIINIITSPGGKKSQDKLFASLMETYLGHAVDFGVNKNNIKALMMWCEIEHLGGSTPVKRIFNRCGKNPTMDQIMSALKKDQQNGNGSQVGDRIFQSRHDCCYKWINQYAKTQSSSSSTTPAKKAEIKTGIDFSKYTGKISNSGSDERGRYSGGQAGDQTGNEWTIKAWYNRPWTCVLRYPDQKVRELIAELGIEAANNSKIGYDQNQRYTYWTQLKNAGYRPSKITVNCEADCSAGVIANTRAAGYLLNIPALKNIEADYTGDMRQGYRKAGFQVLTASKYLTGYNYLVPGDILLYDNHHTATNLGIGKNSNYKQSTTPSKESKTNTSTKTTDLNYTKKYTGIVTADALYVRKWAGKEYDPLTSIPVIYKDQKVDICDTVKANDGTNWYFIKINNERYGFASSKFIKKV